MVKSDDQVIQEWKGNYPSHSLTPPPNFTSLKPPSPHLNDSELVNMSPSELKDWLETSDSQDSGWSKDNDGKVEEDGEGHESVGHESGRKIVCSFLSPSSLFSREGS